MGRIVLRAGIPWLAVLGKLRTRLEHRIDIWNTRRTGDFTSTFDFLSKGQSVAS